MCGFELWGAWAVDRSWEWAYIGNLHNARRQGGHTRCSKAQARDKLVIVRKRHRGACQQAMHAYTQCASSCNKRLHSSWVKTCKSTLASTCVSEHTNGYQHLRMPGVEPGSQAWEACMMPLHYMRYALPESCICIHMVECVCSNGCLFGSRHAENTDAACMAPRCLPPSSSLQQSSANERVCVCSQTV